MLSREYVSEGHTKRVTITRSDVGWHLREEQDDHVVRNVTFNDWHRVERALQVFEVARDDPYSTNR
jgi:hypothetical protein